MPELTMTVNLYAAVLSNPCTNAPTQDFTRIWSNLVEFDRFHRFRLAADWGKWPRTMLEQVVL